MAGKDKKKSKSNKSKSKSNQKAPPQIPPYKVTGVKECLVWHQPKGEMKNANPDLENKTMRTTKYLPAKTELGKSKTREYDWPEDYSHAVPKVDDCGTVREAMRGWPDQQYQPSTMDQEQEEEEANRWKPTRKDKKTGRTSPPKKSKITVPDGPDPNIADLIAYRFMYEHQKQQQEDQDREANEAMAARRSAVLLDPRNIKTTKASQLRAIHLLQKVESDPKDLWKMSRFTKSAQPHLSSFRPRNKTTQTQYGVGSDPACPTSCLVNA